MRILINGSTITEAVSENITKIREFKRNEIIEVDFREEDPSHTEKLINHIKKNKRLYTRLVIVLALTIPSSTLTVYAGALTDIAIELYAIVKDAAYGICLLGAATEGTKCLVNGTIDNLGKVTVKYITFALMIKFLPRAVDMIFTLGGK
ncbi:MAG: hypothetical protein ACRCXT_21860 [Paraclostridium sp.]